MIKTQECIILNLLVRTNTHSLLRNSVKSFFFFFFNINLFKTLDIYGTILLKVRKQRYKTYQIFIINYQIINKRRRRLKYDKEKERVHFNRVNCSLSRLVSMMVSLGVLHFIYLWWFLILKFKYIRKKY